MRWASLVTTLGTVRWSDPCLVPDLTTKTVPGPADAHRRFKVEQ